MKNLIKLLSLLFFVIIFISCSTVRVTMPASQTEKIDKVVLISTFLGIQKPLFPLIDAAAINGKTNSIAGEIIPMFSERINGLREDVASSLKKGLNCSVIYGEELHNSHGFNRLKEENVFPEALSTKDKNFPEIAFAKNDINPFNFEKGKIEGYFNGSENYRDAIIRICKNLNTDYVAVSYSFVQTVPVYMTCSFSFRTNLRLFNKEGECIAYGSNYSKPAPLSRAGELVGYERAIDKHSELLQPIVDKIAAKFN